MTAAATMWDLSLRKQWRHGSLCFDLDVRLATAAPSVALLGPSGAGKTQTLRLIAGIARPDAGRVAIAGRVLGDSDAGVWLTPQQRRLAFVFQDYALFPHLTLRQNIAFARHRGWRNPSRDAGAAAVERWIDTFALRDVADHHPHQLSGGQRQRAALARALVLEPTALLLDEPFAALDRPLRERLRDELKDLRAQLALPMMIITHDDDDARALADEVVHLIAGRVVGRSPEAT
jgi:molybdate transport system ATP-binding protein